MVPHPLRFSQVPIFTLAAILPFYLLMLQAVFPPSILTSSYPNPNYSTSPTKTVPLSNSFSHFYSMFMQQIFIKHMLSA